MTSWLAGCARRSQPADMIDELFVADLVYLAWEILRGRRLKFGLLQASLHEVLQVFLNERLDYEAYAEDFAAALAEILAEILEAARQKDLAEAAAEILAEVSVGKILRRKFLRKLLRKILRRKLSRNLVRMILRKRRRKFPRKLCGNILRTRRTSWRSSTPGRNRRPSRKSDSCSRLKDWTWTGCWTRS